MAKEDQMGWEDINPTPRAACSPSKAVYYLDRCPTYKVFRCCTVCVKDSHKAN
jgi:hypothetical protein